MTVEGEGEAAVEEEERCHALFLDPEGKEEKFGGKGRGV